MKVVLQRVSRASVRVESKIVGSIGLGLVLLVGVEQGDSQTDSTYLVDKIAELRIFSDEAGKMNKSIKEVQGSALIISQFTLIADWRKGRRPGFTRAAEPKVAEELYLHFVKTMQNQGIPVALGCFGAHMEVELVNDGPVTLILSNQACHSS